MNQQTTPRRPGDRGRWYFQMLGIEPEGGPTTLQEVARGRDATKTTELVTGMWDQTEELAPANGDTDPLADWSPTELSSKASSKRRVRWPVVDHCRHHRRGSRLRSLVASAGVRTDGQRPTPT